MQSIGSCNSQDRTTLGQAERNPEMSIMPDYKPNSGLSVPLLVDYAEKEALSGLAITAEQFWSGFGALVAEHAPISAILLAKRDDIQARIDNWRRKVWIGRQQCAGLCG